MSGSTSSDRAAGVADGQGDEPLTLTVHSMPLATAGGGRTRTGRWKMLAVLLVCATPVIASYFTYYVVRPEGRRNFGTLVQPVRPMPDLPAARLDGSAGPLRAQRGQWLLVVVAGGACDPGCERNLYLQRQLREALGKEKDKLDRVWLVNDTAPVREAIRPGLQGATVLRVPPAALAQWLEPEPGQPLESHLYLIDPMGHWMLRFPANLDAQGASRAKRDIDRVIRAANSWDQPGRDAEVVKLPS
jgi:hypothetical protein